MDRQDKAKYYDWLQREYVMIENRIKAIPKLSIEEQSKNVNMVEYNAENQKKVDNHKRNLLKISQELEKLF
jgi:hypothetical protein|tara:strand:- start:4603 stop:4815 length:213 start_codon:yes stop_codon:yes gene_type:complete